MSELSKTLVVSCAEDVAVALRGELDSIPGTETRSAERRNLDADVAAWIVISNLAAQAVPHILTFLQQFLDRRGVKRIKIDDIEIENPTRADVERLLARLDPPKAQSQ
jgi:hypothetical protein